MDKINKIALIFFIFLVNIFLLSLLQEYPISISLNNATFFQIPIIFWLVIFITPFLLFIIAKTNKNKFVLIICAMFYFFIFYSYGLYFMIHPTTSDIGGAIELQEYLPSITHIGAAEIYNIDYLQFPIFFIFSKIFSTILGISPVLTINIGFMSLITLFPVFLILYYTNRDDLTNPEKYFIIPALFLTLCYYFLNDQFVPQFLALIYLVILFGCYIKYKEWRNKLFFILVIIFYILTVFSHSFIFLFFLIAIIFEKIWMEYIEKNYNKSISYEMIIILIMIPSLYISVYIQELKAVTIFGGSSRIIGYIFSPSGSIQTYPLYNLVPQIYDLFISTISKFIVAGAFIIVSIGFLLYILKKKGIFDFGIIIGTAAWFIMGFFRVVLGERSLQIAPIALSSHYKHSHKIFSYLSKIIIVLILISPFFSICNTSINESIAGEGLIQDYKENIAGKFVDYHIENQSNPLYILSAHNAYPLVLKNNTYSIGLISIILNSTKPRDVDFLIESPKLIYESMYYDVILPINLNDFTIYNGKNINIISLWNE